MIILLITLVEIESQPSGTVDLVPIVENGPHESLNDHDSPGPNFGVTVQVSQTVAPNSSVTTTLTEEFIWEGPVLVT